MEGLRQKLENQGLNNVVYMVVNHQGEQAQRLHAMLGMRLSENITLYKQDAQQPDVWQTLGGEKDDFFIYDRCGRLTHHISLPYSIIGQGHVEGAIKDTYCKRMCGECTHESAEIPEECTPKADAQPDTDAVQPAEEDTGHGHHQRHHHPHPGHNQPHGQGHGHGHGHGIGRDHNHGQNQHPGGNGQGHDHNHGQNQHPGGNGPGHDHNHGHHLGHHSGHGGDHRQSQQDVRQQEVSQRQDHLDAGQMQQAVQIHQIPHEAN